MGYRSEYHAEIIADSLHPTNGERLTTMEITFPRFVLAEFNTHRAFSRNSASSRAIPLTTQLERLVEQPFIFADLPREQPGMSGGSELQGWERERAAEVLFRIRQHAEKEIQRYLDRFPDKKDRVHKSVLNRTFEWAMWHTVIVSSTEWENFFHQRCSPQAQPEIRKVAELMRKALSESEPALRQLNDIHLPYISEEELRTIPIRELVKVSVARCARVSYLTHDGKRDIAEDIRMFDETLWANGHWSPMEHVAMVTLLPRRSNFGDGWTQIRQFAENDGMDLVWRAADLMDDEEYKS